VVVDREVEVLPAGQAAAVADVAAEHALAERPEAAELLYVNVDELARARTLVANDRSARRSRQTRDAVAAKHLPDSRGRQAELAGDDQWPRLCVLPSGQDPLLELPGEPPRLVLWNGRPVGQRRPTTLLVTTPKPIAGRTARTASGRGRLRTLTSTNKRDKTATRLE